jgi:hypothetical protein
MQGYVTGNKSLSSNYMKLHQPYNLTVPKESVLKMKYKLGEIESISSCRCSSCKNTNYKSREFLLVPC